MDKLLAFMNRKFVPLANKIGKNKIISSIQEAIMTALPLILVSSIITVLSLFNEIVPGSINLGMISDFSFGIVGLIVAFLISHNILEKNQVNNKKLLAGATALAIFLMTIGPTFDGEGNITFIQARFGATGLFMSMLVGIIVGVVMTLFSKFSFFKKDSLIPDFVIVWFDSLLPIFFLLGAALFFTQYLNVDVFVLITKVFQPLTAVVQTFPGFVLVSFITSFLYSFGISPWLLTPIFYPVYMQALAENHEAVKAGGEAVNIATNEINYALIYIGGTGGTLGLVLLMAFLAKSTRLKMIGRATLGPSIFNINEPVMFGAPIVLNPFLMIGFWINTIFLSASAYLLMSFKVVPIPTDPYLLWYLPYPLPSFLATGGSWVAVIACLVLFSISVLIWFPLFKLYDNQQVQIEKEA